SLVDAWLEEHAAVPVAPELEEDKTLIEAPVLDTSFDTVIQEQKADHSLNVNSSNNVVDNSIDGLSETWSIEQPDSSYDTEPLAKPETVSTSAIDFAAPVDTISNVAKVADMTPTNT